MNVRISPVARVASIVFGTLLLAAPVLAQERPAAEPPLSVEDSGEEPPVALGDETPPAPPPAAPAARDDAAAARGESTVPGRRPTIEGTIKFGYKEEPLDDKIFTFIAEATGKVVMPVKPLTLKNQKITLITDETVTRDAALNMLFRSMRLNAIGVIEKEDVVVIGLIDEIMNLGILPVVPAEKSIADRPDKGSLIVKLFQLEKVRAEEIFDLLSENLPPQGAQISVDSNSNKIMLAADVGYCQHVEQLIQQFDNQYVEAQTRTFRLAHADATRVSENILDLFENATQTGGQTQRTQRNARTPARGGGAQAARPGASAIGPEIELRVTVNEPRNTVTVVAEPTVIEEIQNLIDNVWDLPRSPGTAKIYTLYYTDPIKVAEKLNSLLGDGGGGGGGRAAGARGGAAGAAGGAVSDALAGIYNIEAFPDANQLLVFCKTEEAVDFLDNFIAEIDQPSDIGLPMVLPLKHANAVELADELNVLLAPSGQGGDLARPEEGLSGRTATEEGGLAAGDAESTGGTISFPWTRGGRQGDEQTPETSLIGRVRVVPIVRQNALAVLCPFPQQEAMRELVEYFDRPGRQVMVAAVIAAVDLTDELNLGLRWSSGDGIFTGNDDNLLAGSADFMGTIDNPLDGIFDTSILDSDFSVNVALQLLQQKTNVRIIQQPTVFTADNQEAIFFDGQDIPFITATTITDQGNPTDSFEYREVGVTLNVRPRITVNREIDLDVLLVLSNTVPGQTLFGGAIIDRRETRTHVVVNDGQTVVISGILIDEETKITRQVPFFGDIPIVGELFKSRENQTTTRELILFVTPEVVDNIETDPVQRGYRDRLEEINRPLREQWEDWQENPARIRDRVLPSVQDQVEDEADRIENEYAAPATTSASE